MSFIRKQDLVLRPTTPILIGVLLALMTLGCQSQPKRPNVVLIMGDDIGFSDIGCFGSEIQTPNLDRLAQAGVRFSTFYNRAKCETTRSTLLTGLYAGDQRALNVSQVLRQEGYFTVHAGKEHFQKWVPQSAYAENAFDQSLTFWATNEFHIPPSGEFQRPFFINGVQVEANELEVDNPPFFKTDVITDYAIRWLETQRGAQRPFFLYLPFHAAHYPLQAKQSDIQKYQGTYQIGWDSVRVARLNRIKELGLLPGTTNLSSPSDNINQFRGHPSGDEDRRALIPIHRPWNDLSGTEQDELDLEMAVFAAMVDCMDQNIGRVIDWLKANGEYQNTIIMYLSDNGSCPYDSNRGFDYPPGPAESYRTLSAAWANAGNTPFRYFKQFGHEGGGRTHFIIHWPQKLKNARISHQPAGIVDIFPTILDLLNINYPEESNGSPTIPLHGRSLKPILEGETIESTDFIISGFSERFRMFRLGDQKIVRTNDQAWELYDLSRDPTELQDLSQKHPERVFELEAKYRSIKANLDSLTAGHQIDLLKNHQ